MKFTELKFAPHPHIPGDEAILAVHIFPNSYGVCVVRFPGSYGYMQGLYELYIIKGTLDNYQACYNTHITNDILGHLDEIRVEDIMCEVENL
jgi:hypothetical protein